MLSGAERSVPDERCHGNPLVSAASRPRKHKNRRRRRESRERVEDLSPMEGARVPPEVSTYAELHDLFHLFQWLLQELLIVQPDDPITYLIHLLQWNNQQVPRVFLLGPPSSGKKTLGKLVSEKLRVPFLTPESLMANGTSGLVQEAVTLSESQQEIPAELWLRILQERLQDSDCLRRGWLLAGLPWTHHQARVLQTNGVIPEHVVFLEADDHVLMERSWTKKLNSDREGEAISKEATQENLRKYREQELSFRTCYEGLVRGVNADQPLTEVVTKVLGFVRTSVRSSAPHRTRVVLLGASGSGRSLQASRLSHTLCLVNVDCVQLLQQEVVAGNKLSSTIAGFLNNHEPVPDILVLRVLCARLEQPDCAARGWVLHHFPRTENQATLLLHSGHMPTRVLLLDVTDNVAKERICQHYTDPITGKRYLATLQPPPNATVAARLRRAPRDEPNSVQKRLDTFRAMLPGVLKVLGGVERIHGDQDPDTIAELLESKAINPRLKPLSFGD
uniref:Uncharacterized protein n=1 Tax=Eptatretus burgeri TaxID=7764 RepID=A0A8C4Q078_EPTBU